LIETLENHRVVTLIGNAKNAGKTTVLNTLIIAQKSEIIGVTSIGLDGEDLDQITRLPKPKITLFPGMLVATASACLPAATAEFETLETTAFVTPLGAVVIVRIRKEGTMLVAGPSDVKQMTALTKRMMDYGAKRIYVDGAFARQQFSRVGDAAILVVGANQSPEVERVVSHALCTIRKFQLPGIPLNFPAIPISDKLTLLMPKGTTELPWSSTLDVPSNLFESIPSDALALYIPKAVTESFVLAWLKHKPTIQIPWLIQSPAHVVICERTLERLLRSNQLIYAINPLHLVAVCVNPFSPNGYSFDALRFSASLSERTSLPVYNVLDPR
jgi:hypothetical protein